MSIGAEDWGAERLFLRKRVSSLRAMGFDEFQLAGNSRTPGNLVKMLVAQARHRVERCDAKAFFVVRALFNPNHPVKIEVKIFTDLLGQIRQAVRYRRPFARIGKKDDKRLEEQNARSLWRNIDNAQSVSALPPADGALLSGRVTAPSVFAIVNDHNNAFLDNRHYSDMNIIAYAAE